MRDFLWMVSGGLLMLAAINLFPFVQEQFAPGMERDVGLGVFRLVLSLVAGVAAERLGRGRDE